MKYILWRFILIFILINPVVLLGQNSTSPLLKPSQIYADIDTLINTLKNVHPTYGKWSDANNIDFRIDSIKKTITKPISKLEFFRIMQPLITIDGHTTLFYNGPLCENEEKPLFPFKLVIHDDKLYIKANFSEDPSLEKGTVIEKINGIPSIEIVRNLYRYIPGEREVYKARKLEEQFHVFMALVYGSFSSFTITANNSTLRLNGAGWEAFQEPSKPKFELRFYDDDIAYIYKRMFMPPWDFLDFMDSAYTVIAERNIKHVIIDNLSGGGLTDLADTLTSYFAKNPYRLMEQKETKLSSLTEQLLADKKANGYIKDGYFHETFSTHNPTRKNKFSGKTYILTGPRSYSTGTCFPAAAKCYNNAIIVGEESGQPLLSNGDQNQFILPNTVMTIITALSIVQMPCNGGDTVHGVFPDYTYTPSLNDLLNDNNYTLDYTIGLIKKTTN